MTTVIVIAMNQKGDVLIGQSSPYLIEHPTFGLTPDKQRVYFQDAKTKKKISKTFNELLSRIPTIKPIDPSIVPTGKPLKIKISKESIEDRGSYFSGKYRSNLKLNAPGFIKGNINKKEQPQDAARREFKEETGVEFDRSKFTACMSDSNVFLLNLSDEEATNVFTSWKAMDDRNEGEVFNLRWEPLATLDRTTLNEDSRDALNTCFPIPGGRRRRTRRKSVLSRTTRKARRL